MPETINCAQCGKETDDWYAVIRKGDRGLYSTRSCVYCHELEVRLDGRAACRENNNTGDGVNGKLTFEHR